MDDGRDCEEGAPKKLDHIEKAIALEGDFSPGAPADPGHVRRLLRSAQSEIEERGEADVEIAGRRFRIKSDFLRDLEERSILPQPLGAEGA